MFIKKELATQEREFQGIPWIPEYIYIDLYESFWIYLAYGLS